MCALYTLHTTAVQIRQALQSFDAHFSEEVRGRYLPFSQAPVVIAQGGKSVLKNMNFSLIPSWSKVRKPKFATHNARLYSDDGKTAIYSKPTWKTPFLRHHCVVPISQFIEPIYQGELAGNMVQFFGDQLMLAAGIFDTWIDQQTGEVVDSFSILTDDPVEFVKLIGHDRTPVFLNHQAADEWLRLDTEPQHMVDFLLENRKEPAQWKTEIDRALKPGWEKRKS